MGKKEAGDRALARGRGRNYKTCKYSDSPQDFEWLLYSG
jgi:hypothetical protein